MNNSWRTTIFGFLAALPQLMQAIGFQGFGHFGSVSVDQALSGVGLLGLGYLAKDHGLTGGTKPSN